MTNENVFHYSLSFNFIKKKFFLLFIYFYGKKINFKLIFRLFVRNFKLKEKKITLIFNDDSIHIYGSDSL